MLQEGSLLPVVGAKERVVLFVPGRAQPSWPILSPPVLVFKRCLLARNSGQAQPEFPSCFQTTQAPGRHAQKSHWREAGRWHRVASPDNSTRRKMAASSTDAKNHTAQGPGGDQLSLHGPATASEPGLRAFSKIPLVAPSPPNPKPWANSPQAPPPPSLSSAPGSRGREAQVLLAPWMNPRPSRHQSALNPQSGRSHLGTAGSSLKNIS